MRKTNTQKGITLIALIITIVVLLILAVVAINAVTGDGIIQHAVNAKTEYKKAQDEENSMISYYQAYLDSEGQVGKWVQNKTIVTRVNEDGTVDKLEVGDTVDYKQKDGSKYSYIEDDKSTEITWAVLGAKDGKVLLVSENNLPKVILRGEDGYNTGIETLNLIGADYDNGIGAVEGSGRSINVDDINRVTGYNPLKTGTGEPFYRYDLDDENNRVTQYLNTITYTLGVDTEDVDNDGNTTEPRIYYTTKIGTQTISGASEEPDANQVFKKIDGTDLAQGESITIQTNGYVYYPVSLSLDPSTAGEVKGISSESKAYKLLFGNTEVKTGNPYWLATSCVLRL